MRRIRTTYFLFLFLITTLLMSFVLMLNIFSMERRCNKIAQEINDVREENELLNETVNECVSRSNTIEIKLQSNKNSDDETYVLADAKAINSHTKYVDNPERHVKKIYTEYTAVTKKSSLQYKLLYADIDGDNVADILHDKESGVRIVIDQYGTTRFCVAVGTYWANGEIGRFIDFVMENGNIIPCITCDVKQDIHTIEEKGKYGFKANDLIEFYTDPKARGYVDSYIDEDGNIVKMRYKAGDVSTSREDFVGAVTKVIVYDDYLEGFENQ